MVGVELTALTLAVGTVIPPPCWAFVRGDPAPVQGLGDVVFRTRNVAFLVRILDSQDKLSAGLPGKEVVVEGGAQPSDVEGAGGGGGKTDTYGAHRL